MTGIEVAILIWLGGWIGTSSVLVAKDCTPPPHVISRGECVTLSLIGGAAWPVGTYEAVKDE